MPDPDFHEQGPDGLAHVGGAHLQAAVDGHDALPGPVKPRVGGRPEHDAAVVVFDPERAIVHGK